MCLTHLSWHVSCRRYADHSNLKRIDQKRIMNTFALANSALLSHETKEDKVMCEAIEELFADKIEMLQKLNFAQQDCFEDPNGINQYPSFSRK